MRRKTGINFSYLTSAINQTGTWKGSDIEVDRDWFFDRIKSRAARIDWDEVKNDIRKFLKPKGEPLLEIWNSKFVNDRIDKRMQYLPEE